jgi:hypothetical protein
MSYFVYSIGDLVADPVSNTLGIITEVKEKEYSTLYKINWQDDRMNNWEKKLWDHYEICSLTRNGKV